MAISECGLNISSESRELQSHGSLDFPLAAYSSMHDENREEDTIPWHYHEEIEFICIKEGEMEVRTPSISIVLKEGELCAINSNELHYAKATRKCTLNSLVFSHLLITGSEDSAFSKKYIKPLIASRSFSLVKLNEEVQFFINAFDAMEKEEDGFEFIARENLSKICLSLYKRLEETLDREISPNLHDIRLKKMLSFIHDNFKSDILLKDIANEANISEREALRCFERTIEYSPIQYLIKYRVQKGAEMLKNEKSLSVSEIATNCGFESPSNFSKLFKRYYKTTPKDYRANSKLRSE